MEKVLGKHYLKANWVDKNDIKECIKTFFELSDFIFYKADENYVCFPLVKSAYQMIGTFTK